MSNQIRRLLAWTFRVLAILAGAAFSFSFFDESWRPWAYFATMCVLWWLSSRIDPKAWRWIEG